jgi:hypothetical protein
VGTWAAAVIIVNLVSVFVSIQLNTLRRSPGHGSLSPQVQRAFLSLKQDPHPFGKSGYLPSRMDLAISEQQQQEITALKSIYAEDFIECQPRAWKVRRT